MKDWASRIALGAFAIFISYLIVSNALAQSVVDPKCIERDEGIEALQELAGEVRRFYAIGRNNIDLIEIYVAPNGKFTITYSRAGEGTICWVVKGNNFTEVDEEDVYIPGEDS